MSETAGKLYIVATPIGNLQDITLRALDTLRSVKIIAAEDTRKTKELLNHFNIKTKIISFNEFATDNKTSKIISKILEGYDVALVSDAGTPLISDPGAKLTKSAIENNIDVLPIPGACAAISALVVSGIQNSNFKFIGFLPEENKKRKEILDNLVSETATMIFYISLHNLKNDISTLIKVFGEERYASLSRELTKKYEENIRGKLINIYDYVCENNLKGEFVLVLSGIEKKHLKQKEVDEWNEISVYEHYNMYIEEGLSEKEAMKKVANDRDVRKSEIYKLLKVK